MGALSLLAAFVAVALLPRSAEAANEWLTYHHDAERTGIDQEASEPITPKLAWQSPDLGAPIWSQPVIYHQLAYVATVGDQLYAINVSTGQIAWETNAGVPVPSGELPCGDITPTVGIVGTPVIDPETNSIYAVADTWNAETREAAHVLEGFNLQTGEPTMEVPVDPPGADPKALLNRTALTLWEGRLYFGFGGNDGDCSDYQGTVVSVPESGGAPTFWQDHPAPPAISGGPIWAPEGLVVDGRFGLLAATGNPDPGSGGAHTFDFSDSLIELSPGSDFTADPTSSPNPSGWLEPPTWEEDSNSDLDLGSAGPTLLPAEFIFEAGKRGEGYLVDQLSLRSEPSPYPHQAIFEGRACASGGSWGGDVYFEETIYVSCSGGLTALSLNLSKPSFSELWHGPSDAYGPPIVSAGKVWDLATGGGSGGGKKLYGLDPLSGKVEVEETLPSPIADHFGSPSAAGGRLFVSTGSTVTAYQIAQIVPEPGEPPPPTTEPPGPEPEPEPTEPPPIPGPEPVPTTEPTAPPTGQGTGTGAPPGQPAAPPPTHATTPPPVPAGTAPTGAAPPIAGGAKPKSHEKSPRLALLGRHLAVRHGRVHLRLSCEPKGADCRAEISIFTGAEEHKLAAGARVGHTELKGPGDSGLLTVSVGLSHRALRLLRGRESIRVSVALAVAGGPKRVVQAQLERGPPARMSGVSRARAPGIRSRAYHGRLG